MVQKIVLDGVKGIKEVQQLAKYKNGPFHAKI